VLGNIMVNDRLVAAPWCYLNVRGVNI